LEWPLHNESLNNQWIDNQGNVWFLSFKKDASELTYTNGNMEVFYSNSIKGEFLSLVGVAKYASASDIEDPACPFIKLHQLNNIETPVRLVKFVPQEAYYWDDVVKDMVPLLLFDMDDQILPGKMVA
jgi:hypothetical protein